MEELQLKRIDDMVTRILEQHTIVTGIRLHDMGYVAQAEALCLG
ncbi:hypothetical protein [Hymenobacter setariae]|nr:hypothetical protein [Hymenobacter setariae]